MGKITTFSNVGANNLSDLSDVNTSLSASGGLLVYDGNVWVGSSGAISHSYLDNLDDDDHSQYLYLVPTGSTRNILRSEENGITLLDICVPNVIPSNFDVFRIRDTGFGADETIFSITWEFVTHNEWRIISHVQHLFDETAGNITEPIISFVGNNECGIHLTDNPGHRVTLVSHTKDAFSVKSTGDICEAVATNILSVGCTGFGAQIRIYHGHEHDNYVGFRAPSTLSSNLLWRLPNTDGSSGTFLSTNGDLSLSFNTPDHNTLLNLTSDDHTHYIYNTPLSSSRNVISPTGNNIQSLKLLGSTHVTGIYNIFSIENTDGSGIFQIIDLSGNYAARSYYPIEIRNQNPIRLYNTTGYIDVRAPSGLTASYILNLPVNIGSSGRVLKTDGNGNTEWANIPIPIGDEEIDDRVSALLQNNTGITWTYDDGANTLTPTINLGAFNTDSLPEGSNNLYFSDERVDDRVADLVQDTSSVTWTYNDTLNILTANVSLSPFTSDNLSEGSTNKYYSSGRFNAAFATKTTDDLSQGSTNLYFANELVDDRVATLIVGVSGIFKSYDDPNNILYLGINPTGLPDSTQYLSSYVTSSSRNILLSSGSNVLALDIFASGLISSNNFLRIRHQSSGFGSSLSIIESRPNTTVVFQDLSFSTSGVSLPSPTYPYIRGYQTSTLNLGQGVGDGGYILFGGSGSGGRGGIIDIHGINSPNHGGNIITSLGGGTLDTNSGYLQLGVSGSRTTLIKSTGTNNLDIYLPSNSGVLALLTDITGGPGGSVTGLDDLDDITITTPSSGQILKYDSAQWINTAFNVPTGLNDLEDVTITTPASGHILSYNNGWANISTAGTGFPASPYPGQSFYRTDLSTNFNYDATRGKWLGDLESFSSGRNTSPTSGEVLRWFDNITNNNNRGFMVPYPITIVGAMGKVVNTGTYNISLLEGTSVVLTPLSFNNTNIQSDLTLNYDFNTSNTMGISFGLRSGTPGVTAATIWFRRLGT